ncbi:MAG: hypothetical protein LVQ63_07475 [Thermoplasmatales archaeon]|nr:hypothetical protein [Thermoplasmatales archaeon]
MNLSRMSKIILAITVAVIVIAAAVPLFYYYEKKGGNDMLYAGSPPFYPSSISLQFLNPNGSSASTTLVSVYVYTPNLQSYPQIGQSLENMTLREYTNPSGLISFPISSEIVKAADAWIQAMSVNNPENHGGINQSLIITATEDLSNNSEWSVIKFLPISFPMLLNNLNLTKAYSYRIPLDIFVNNSKYGFSNPSPSAVSNNLPLSIPPGNCNAQYMWVLNLSLSFNSPNLWFPISWVSNQTMNGQGSIDSYMGYQNYFTAFEVGVYNTFKGGFSANTSSPTNYTSYQTNIPNSFTNYKSAVLFINGSIYLDTFQWVYQHTNCQLTWYNDYEFDFLLNDIKTNGNYFDATVNSGQGNISSLLPPSEMGMPNYVYHTTSGYTMFSGNIGAGGNVVEQYDVLSVNSSSLADKIVDLYLSGPATFSYTKYYSTVYHWASVIYSTLLNNLPVAGTGLSAIQWQKVAVYSSAIQVKNPQSVSNYFTVYNYRENYAYNLSGWGSGTTDLLLSYYNVTES